MSKVKAGAQPRKTKTAKQRPTQDCDPDRDWRCSAIAWFAVLLGAHVHGDGDRERQAHEELLRLGVDVRPTDAFSGCGTSARGGEGFDVCAPLAVGPDELARLLGISPRLRRTWSESGRLPAPVIHEGRVQRWAVDELRSWLQAGAPRRAEWEVRKHPNAETSKSPNRDRGSRIEDGEGKSKAQNPQPKA